MSDAKTIHEEAVRERDQRKVKAGMTLADDIRHARHRYEREMFEADRMYKLRIKDHPLPELNPLGEVTRRMRGEIE